MYVQAVKNISESAQAQDILKGWFTQKWKFCQYLLTLMLFQTSMCLFVLLDTKEDIWKNVLIKQISFPIDYHSMVVNGNLIEGTREC